MASSTPEELVGKTVILVVNVKAATLMGVRSQGMALGTAQQKDAAVSVQDRPMPRGTLLKQGTSMHHAWF
jgi:tRNA-binding EMAP/Myf-like protein